MRRPSPVCIVIVLLLLSAAMPTKLLAETKLPPLELTVVERTGTVEVHRADTGGWTRVVPGDELLPSDRIRTGPESHVTMSMPGVSVTKVGAESELKVHALSRRTVERNTMLGSDELNVNEVRLEAVEGSVHNAVRNHDQIQINYDLLTPGAVAGVRGTVFMVDLTASGDVVTGVLEGQVFLYRPGDRRRGRPVHGNEIARLEQGEAGPATPEPLPVRLRRELAQFQQLSKRSLEVPPWIGDFQLNGRSFRKSIKIVYDRQQRLTLSGVIEAQEGRRTVQSVAVEGGLGEQVIDVDGRREQWSTTGQPPVPGEGKQRTLNVRVRGTDSDGLHSPWYDVTIILVNPRKSGHLQTPGDRLRPGTDAGEMSNPKTQRALAALARLRGAFVGTDAEAYLNGFSARTSIATVRGRVPWDGFRQQVSDLFRVLETPSWNMVVRNAEIEGDRVRLIVDSRYRGSLVELLGVDPGVIGRVPSPSGTRRRVIRRLETTATEQYVFEMNRGTPRLVSVSTGLFLDESTVEEARYQLARWQVKSALFGLFYFYERGDAKAFADLVHPSFQNNDDNGFRHSYSSFMRSVRSDLEHLSGMDHAIRLESIQFQGGLSTVRVKVDWDRRARLGHTNQLWLERNQSSVFRFTRRSPYRLIRISGDPVFGMSSAWTGSTLVSGGTVDGSEFTPLQVDDGMVIDDASGDEFPELDSIETSEALCFSGTIDSDPTEDANWCDDVTVTANVTIPSGLTVTVDPETILTIDGDVSITVDGTFEASSTTINHPSNFTTPGLIFQAGSTGNFDGVTFDQADISLRVNGGQVTMDNGTFKAYDTDDSDGGSVQLQAFGGKVTVENSRFETVENPGSSSAIRMNNAAEVTLTSNTFTGPYQVYVRASSGFTGGLTSSLNNYNGGGNTTWGVANQSSSGGSSAGSMSFDRDVFKNFDRGICIVCNGGSGKDLTVTNSDFIDNNQMGIAAGGSIGTVTMDGNYLGGNNTNSCYTMDTSTPDDTATIYPQYTGASSVSNPRSSPTRASDPGYGSCGT